MLIWYMFEKVLDFIYSIPWIWIPVVVVGIIFCMYQVVNNKLKKNNNF